MRKRQRKIKNQKLKRTTKASKKYTFQLPQVSGRDWQLDCSKPRTKEGLDDDNNNKTNNDNNNNNNNNKACGPKLVKRLLMIFWVNCRLKAVINIVRGCTLEISPELVVRQANSR